MSNFPRSIRKSTQTAHGLRVLTRAGMVPGLGFGRALSALREVRRWGPLVGALRYTVRNRADALALVDEYGPLTYQALDHRSDALARALTARGLKPGYTIAVLCRDHRWMIESLLACAKLGVHVLLLNTGFAGPQIADVLKRERAHGLIHDEEFFEVVEAAQPRMPRFLGWQEPGSPTRPDVLSLEALIHEAANGQSGRIEEPAPPGNIVLLSSGTTGRPKGIRREVRSGLSAADFLDRIPLRANESTFIAAPMFHAIGFSQLALGFALGSTLVVQRRFDPLRLARAVHENQCTAMVLVPTMLRRLLELRPETLSEWMASLRVAVVSGSPLLPALSQRASDVLGNVLYNFYGSTEAAVVSVATPSELRRAPGTVGRSPHSCTVELYDAQGVRVTEPHVTGRIFAGGTLASTDHMSKVGNSTGLINTGDLGHFNDEGLLFVEGRDDEMIISGGENVFPSEVENLIAKHYQVKDVAVIGIQDEEFGQRLKAFVVPIPGSGLTEDEIRSYVRASLAKHKVPRDVVLVKSVPRNATGKILRHLLAEYV